VIEQNKEMSWCPTPDCKYAFIYTDPKQTDITPVNPEDQVNQNDQLKCPLCTVHYCLSCRVVFHEGKTCAQYKETALMDENDV